MNSQRNFNTPSLLTNRYYSTKDLKTTNLKAITRNDSHLSFTNATNMHKMTYNKEKEDEIENKGLFAYELYENIDTVSETDDRSSKIANLKSSRSSMLNLQSKRIPSQTNIIINNRKMPSQLNLGNLKNNKIERFNLIKKIKNKSEQSDKNKIDQNEVMNMTVREKKNTKKDTEINLPRLFKKDNLLKSLITSGEITRRGRDSRPDWEALNIKNVRKTAKSCKSINRSCTSTTIRRPATSIINKSSSIVISKRDGIISLGERLYNRGLAIIEKNKNKLLIIKKENAEKEMKECTFYPQLSSNSILLNLRSTYSGDEKLRNKQKINFLNSSTFNNLIAKNKNMASSRDIVLNLTQCNNNTTMNQNKSYLEFEKILTPTNKLNFERNRELLYRERNTSDNTEIRNTQSMNRLTKNAPTIENFFNTEETYKKKKMNEESIYHGIKLFQEAERMKFNKRKLEEQFYSQHYPFTPTIRDKTNPNLINFFFRLQKWVDKRNEKYVNDLEKIKYDTKTGLRLFSPQINNRSKSEYGLNEKNRNKFLKLYEEWKRRELKIKEISLEKEQQKLMLSNLSHVNPHSKEISNEFFKKLFSKLFELLSDRHTNIIDGNNINLSQVPDIIKTILNPIVVELREQNETLVLDEFCTACKHLYNIIPLEQKHSLVDWYKNLNEYKKYQHKNSEFPFKPEINKNTDKILTSSNKFHSDFFIRASECLKNKENKIKNEIEKKMQDKVNVDCTFRPKLITKYNSQHTYSYARHNLSIENSMEKPEKVYSPVMRTCPGGRNILLKTYNYDIKEINEENSFTE